MTRKVHQIKNYNYSYDARMGGPGLLQLISFKRSSLPGLIDMLRNENPVSVTINNQSPGFVFIQTGLEPVGEGEH